MPTHRPINKDKLAFLRSSQNNIYTHWKQISVNVNSYIHIFVRRSEDNVSDLNKFQLDLFFLKQRNSPRNAFIHFQ